MASGLYSHPSPPLRRARIEERGHELDCSLAPRGVGLRTTLHYRKWGEFFRVAYASRDIMASLLQAILSTPQVPVSTLGSREKLSVSTSTPQGQTLKSRHDLQNREGRPLCFRGVRFERDQRVFYARSSACPRFTLTHSVIRYYMFQLEK